MDAMFDVHAIFYPFLFYLVPCGVNGGKKFGGNGGKKFGATPATATNVSSHEQPRHSTSFNHNDRCSQNQKLDQGVKRWTR
jgi:hypothetical protein